MASAVFPQPQAIVLDRSDVDDRHGWGFLLLLLTTATLFIRPADLVPALDDWPIYQVMILACLVVSARPLLRQLTLMRLADRPVIPCLFVLLCAVGVSHLSHGFLWGARASMFEFAKLMALALLVTALVNSFHRLQLFIQWLTLAITATASLALLDRYGIVSISALESIRDHHGSEELIVDRIRGTGIFQDPNDFGLILVTGLVFCACFLTRPRSGIVRYIWLVPAGILLSALALTHSRGAMLSVVCAFPAGVAFFRGGKFGLWPLLGLPVLIAALSGRMTDVTAIQEGTGQSRLQIWSETIGVWRQYPLFGLGEGMLTDEIGAVTHNSFLHCFAELGVFGGIAFTACFVAAGWGLWQYRTTTTATFQAMEYPSMAHWQGFLFVALVAYTAGAMTISRQFVAPTYLVLGLVSAAATIAIPTPQRIRFGNRLMIVSSAASIASLVGFYVVVRLFVHW